MSQYVPTKHTVSKLQSIGITWAEMVDDLRQCGHIQSMAGFPTRQRHLGTKVQAYIEPGILDGEPVLYVVGVRPRVESEQHLPVAARVVGHETRAVKSRKRGGAGRRWPTTWPELIKRIEMHPRARVLKGTNHWLVYLNGQQVDALPATSSDHRAILNACQQLKNKGIDVSRTATNTV